MTVSEFYAKIGRNLQSPVTVKKVKTRKRWFISTVSPLSSIEKTWDGTEPPTILIKWKFCKGKNYKGWGEIQGNKVLLTREDGIRGRKDSQTISLGYLLSHYSLGNFSKVRCLTPRGMHYKPRALLSFISKEKSQLANPICLNPLSPVIIQPPASLRLTHLSSPSVAKFHLSVTFTSPQLRNNLPPLWTTNFPHLTQGALPHITLIRVLMSHWLCPHVIFSCTLSPSHDILPLSLKYHWLLPKIYRASQRRSDSTELPWKGDKWILSRMYRSAFAT